MYFRRNCLSLSQTLAAAALTTLLAAAPALHAQPAGQQPSQESSQDAHLVSPMQLQHQLQADSATRQKNIDTLTQFFSSPVATRAMQSHAIDAKQVQDAIPTLSSAELASLSARASQAQQQFAAGTISNNTLLIIILVLVAVILIAVIH